MKTDIDSLNKLDIEGLNNQLVKACATGHLNLVEILLISPKLKLHPDISANNQHPLRWACGKNQVEVIKYLLTSPKLKKHADIFPVADTVFKEALWHGSEELLQFYIFELNIEKTQLIADVLITHREKELTQKAESMFQARELNQILPTNKSKENKIKL